MNKELRFFAIMFGIIVAIIAGVCIISFVFIPAFGFPSTVSSETENAARCPPIPKGFSEADLVGTWVAGRPRHSDTLVIKADGTYKQIVHVDFAEKSPLNYESDWQRWHLEYSNGFAYLHLDGMRFCGMNSEISCNERNSDGYDFCQDETIDMLNEGILIVLVTSVENPNTKQMQNYASLYYPLGSENSWVYDLQNP